ncbi:MAG TPA: hypothetical protein VFX43_06795 [Chitinophagaceae bacterium]|nr:hypothetical protein [Chitinophagaceae bacterium]
MADFQQTRNNLVQGREDSEQARIDLFASGQRLKALEKQRAALERQKGDNNEVYLRRRNELDHSIRDEKAIGEQQKEKYKGLQGRVAVAQKDFDLFVDPRRELAAGFSNEIPFLLFPLRMETRFKAVNRQAQLWVRVYPDECLVDSFEPLLSRQEVNNAARFWAEYYSAGKPADPAHPDAEVTARRQAAWALLVKAHGDGRAAWIAKQLRPDEADSYFPVRLPQTVILAIAAGSWDPAGQSAITGLFKKIWFAGGNDQLVKQAKDDFNAANPGLHADTIIDTYQPVNMDQKPPLGVKRADVDLQVAVVVFTDLDKKIGKEQGWSQATRVKLLPERLALIRYKGATAMEPVFGNVISYPLFTSPDPTDTDAQFKPDDKGDLQFGESIKWVADFDQAVANGLGFRVNLAPDELAGFTRLMVMGVKLGADEQQGKKELEELINHHYYSKKGFRIVPQGTPTNNTASAAAGYVSGDTPDQTFDLYFNRRDGFTEENEWNNRKDGQWLAEWLGIDYAITKQILHSDGLDQSDARNMNTALWPATLGYVMGSLMEGGFSDDTLVHTRDFFNRFVSGRGPVPAIRIGNQPYGILPTAAFHRLAWMNTRGRVAVFVDSNMPFLKGLYDLLERMENYWAVNFTPSVAHIREGAETPYQTLLDIVGLHPNAVTFHRRYLETLIEMTNAMSLIKPGFKEHPGLVNQTMDFLRTTLGYPTDALPQIAALLGLPWPSPVKWLIDDAPLAEDKSIRPYTADNRNYIKALIDEALGSLDDLRTGKALSERPEAELYRLLKFALEQSYHTSGVDAAASVNAFPKEKIAAMKVEQPFVHQQWQGAITESRYGLLYDTVPAISSTQMVSDVIRDSIKLPVVPAHSAYLAGLLNALDQLKDASTARLERAMVEATDCCTYRLDAWKTGLLTTELALMRGNTGAVDNAQRKTGIYLGAFGWLEHVRPNRNKKITPVQLPGDLQQDFNPDGDKIFSTDPENEGYIHAPSLNQAVTTAVLRNGYLSHGKPDANNVLAVNLSSDRIRRALAVIEGIQAGQSLAALLGYQFERELHDRDDLLNKKIDSYIYPLRKRFPLAADRLKETKSSGTTDPSVDPETVPITAIEARNVIDGTRLITYVKAQTTPSNKTYPFGLTGLPAGDAAIATAITDAVTHLIDVNDAIADMGMAESVHHIVLGNYDRAAGVLDSYSKGNYPQAPDVIRTPRGGATLTHRVGLPFQYIASAAGSPRAGAEPSVNNWLTGMLPPLDRIVCNCSYRSRTDGLKKSIDISMSDIGLTPIDLIYLINGQDPQALTGLDDHFIHYLHQHADLQIDGDITIHYTADPADDSKWSLFQLMPLVRSLRVLLVESKPLTPGDVALPNEASKKDIPSPELPVARVQGLLTALQTSLTAAESAGGVIGYLRGLPDRAMATDVTLTDMRNKAGDTIARAAAFLLELGGFGIPQTAVGSLYTGQQQWFSGLKNKLQELVDRWGKNADEYAALAADPSPDTGKLQAMERLISATPTPGDTITLPVVTGKKAAFDAAFNALKNATTARQQTLTGLIQDIEALSIAPYDIVAWDVKDLLRQIPLFIYDLQARMGTLTDDIEKKRMPAAEAILAGLPMLSPEDQVKQTEAAARMILGDDFKMVPRYPLPAAQAAELSNSWAAKNDLLSFSGAKFGNPQEYWLNGMARVRDKMKHLENCILLRQAFDLTEADLTIHPVQLPFKSTEYHWLALAFPDTIDLEESNTLLYTAFCAAATAAPTEVCGMLADEWTERIPAKEETTGIAFHYDRPNSEAPQTWLLVTPSQLTGNWQWNDLVEALTYTLDAARSRGAEPDQLDKKPFASLLPAVLAPESLYPYSIVLDNKVHYMTAEAVRAFTIPNN